MRSKRFVFFFCSVPADSLVCLTHALVVGRDWLKAAYVIGSIARASANKRRKKQRCNNRKNNLFYPSIFIGAGNKICIDNDEFMANHFSLVVVMTGDHKFFRIEEELS